MGQADKPTDWITMKIEPEILRNWVSAILKKPSVI